MQSILVNKDEYHLLVMKFNEPLHFKEQVDS